MSRCCIKNKEKIILNLCFLSAIPNSNRFTLHVHLLEKHLENGRQLSENSVKISQPELFAASRASWRHSDPRSVGFVSHIHLKIGMNKAKSLCF